MASRIAGRHVRRAPGDEHFPWVGDPDAIVDEVERFVVALGEVEAELDRVLATVLFTDVAGSTEKAPSSAIAGWKELVEEHHRRVRGQLARYRGEEVDTAGDGFFATFDGPARAVRCARSILGRGRPLGHRGPRGRAHRRGRDDRREGRRDGRRDRGPRRRIAGPSEVLVSQTVKDLVAGSGLAFEDAGEHELKGVPDRWRLYRVAG